MNYNENDSKKPMGEATYAGAQSTLTQVHPLAFLLSFSFSFTFNLNLKNIGLPKVAETAAPPLAFLLSFSFYV